VNDFRDIAFKLMLRKMKNNIMYNAPALSQGCCCICRGLLLYLPRAVAVPV